jgi:hypothetical protein
LGGISFDGGLHGAPPPAPLDALLLSAELAELLSAAEVEVAPPVPPVVAAADVVTALVPPPDVLPPPGPEVLVVPVVELPQAATATPERQPIAAPSTNHFDVIISSRSLQSLSRCGVPSAQAGLAGDRPEGRARRHR